MNIMLINRRKLLSIITFIPVLLKNKTLNTPFNFLNERLLTAIPIKTKAPNQGDIRLNKAADFIFNLCNGDKNVFDIATAYRKIFNITLTTSINDCIATLKYFWAIGIIKFK